MARGRARWQHRHHSVRSQAVASKHISNLDQVLWAGGTGSVFGFGTAGGIVAIRLLSPAGHFVASTSATVDASGAWHGKLGNLKVCLPFPAASAAMLLQSLCSLECTAPCVLWNAQHHMCSGMHSTSDAMIAERLEQQATHVAGGLPIHAHGAAWDYQAGVPQHCSRRGAAGIGPVQHVFQSWRRRR